MSDLGDFVHLLATLRSRLIEHANTVGAYPNVKSVKGDLGPRLYRDGCRIEGYVDAELCSGDAVAWWIEFREVDQVWLVESSILLSGSQGQEALREFPDRHAVGVADLICEVDSATTMMVASILREEICRL